MACNGAISNVFVATQKFIQEKLLLCIDSANVTATFMISQVRFTFTLLCLDWNIYCKYQYETIRASISYLSGYQIHFVLKSHVLIWDIQCSLCWWYAISDPKLFVRHFFFKQSRLYCIPRSQTLFDLVGGTTGTTSWYCTRSVNTTNLFIGDL